MLTKEEAREIAWKEIKKLSYFELVIPDEATREEEFGWIFFYTSREFFETGDTSHSLYGNAPLIVNKYDGSIHWTGTNNTPEYFAKKYLEEWKREQQNLREGKSA